MKLPDDLKISIPIEIDIDIHTAQIMCHALNLFIKQNIGKYKLTAWGGHLSDHIEQVVDMELKRMEE